MCQGSHSLAGEKDTGLNKSYREENSPTTVLCVCVCVCVCELVYTKMFPWKYRWQNVSQIWKQKVDWFLCSGFLGNKINKVQRTTCELQTPCTLGSEKAIAPLSSTLAWTISCMEEPGRLQSMRSLRVRRDWATSLSLFTFMHWRRKWQPTPVLLPGESQGRGSLVGCRLWGRTESDTTEAT